MKPSSPSHTDQSLPAWLVLSASSRRLRGRDAVLAATYHLLRERGPSRTTIEGIAAEAGVSKSTIYANWSSKNEIVLEIFTTLAQLAVVIPDTGDLREDLAQVIGRLIEYGQHVNGPAQGIFAEAAHDPVLANAVRTLVTNWREEIEKLVARSVARGLLTETVDLRTAAEMVGSTAMYNVIFGSPDDSAPEVASRLVDPILRAWSYRHPLTQAATS